MGVPEEIRSVLRPKNTVVVDTGLKSDKRFAVLERKHSVCVKGRNPSPRNGRTIGHIIDGAFVPSAFNKSAPEPEVLSYGSSALIHSLSKDIYSDLLHSFSDEATSIMALAATKVINPSVKSDRIAEKYKASFLSRYYPGAHLSKNTITKIHENIGKTFSRVDHFCDLRMARVMKEHHLIIDGMLKEDNSIVNDLSHFSYKAKIKGCKQISVIYAYDQELLEPVCSMVVPGNRTDAGIFKEFINRFHITKGILVADKGFPVSAIQDELDNNPDLAYISPLRRNDVRIRNNSMLDFKKALDGVAGNILYCKKKIKGGKYLYSFMDADKSHLERSTFIERAKKNNDCDLIGYSEKDKTFGLIVFLSNCDISPFAIYQAYKKRWMLEEFFKRYKNDLNFSTTNVQSNFSVYGAEFVNFISSIITSRIIDLFTKKQLLFHDTYGNIMDDLRSLLRSTKADLSAKPLSDDRYWIAATDTSMKDMVTLGLAEAPYYEQPKRKPGRPRKIEKPCENVTP